MKKLSVYLITVFIFFSSFVSYLYGDEGKYAILLFGGYDVMAKKPPGGESNLGYVEYEIAYMYNTLIQTYDYSDENIYVHVVNGDEEDTTYTNFFENLPTNYLPAKPNDLINTFQDIKNAISTDGYEEHLVFIFISGHESHNPAGGINYYQFYPNDPQTDSVFAEWLKDDLFDGTTDPTKYVFVTGFCSSWKFYTPEIEDECYTASYAAADEENGASTISSLPQSSFMKFYVDAMQESLTFQEAFEEAETSLKNAWPEANDDPIKGTKFEGFVEEVNDGWDSEWSLNGDVVAPDAPANLSISNSNNHPRLDWDENSEPDLKEYEVWKYSTAFDPVWRKVATTSNNYWTDNGVGLDDPAERIYYKLKAVDNANNKSSFSDDAYIDGYVIEKPIPSEKIVQKIPEKYQLKTYPNPFNPVAQIQFDLPEASHVNIVIYNIEGKIVSSLANRRFEAGSYTYTFDGSRLSSGIYFCRIQAGSFSAIRQMLLIK